MKLLILFLFLSVSAFSQKYDYVDTWIPTNVWIIPKGADTSILIPTRLGDVDKPTIDKINIKSTEQLSILKKYRWVYYKNGARNVQVLASERILRLSFEEKQAKEFKEKQRHEKLKADSVKYNIKRIK